MTSIDILLAIAVPCICLQIQRRLENVFFIYDFPQHNHICKEEEELGVFQQLVVSVHWGLGAHDLANASVELSEIRGSLGT